jgi:transmembrane sensor
VTDSPDHLPEIDPLTREAIDWVVRLRSGRATTDDAEALQRWRRQSPAHEEAFARAVKLWRDFRTVAEGSPDEALPRREPQAAQSWIRRPVARRAILGGAIAASAAGYMVVRPPLGLWPSLQELTADYRTAKGEQKEIALGPDVSLTLNTETSIAIHSRDGQPQFELIAGEAVVSAKAPATRPLVVTAAEGRIVASQANFNARCIDGVVSVACIAGSLEVQQGARSAQLKENETISYSSRGLGQPITADIAQATSWRSGLLVFHDRSLSDVVEEINRYRPGRIVITNAELGRKIVNATFHINQLDNFFAQAQELFGAKVTRLPAGVALLS